MDSRFPSHWLMDYRVQSLSPEAFRVLVNANTWSVSNRSDGEIPIQYLGMIPHANEKLAEELVSAGLWTPTSVGWLIIDYGTYQTSRAQMDALEHKRRQEAEASKAYRLRQKQKKSGALDSPSYDENHDGDMTESYDDIGKERQGQERPGKAEELSKPSLDEPLSTEGRSHLVMGSAQAGAVPAVSGSLALDPDAWPADPFGLEWRCRCEEQGLETVAAVMAVVGLDESQARKCMAAAFPGRRF